MNNIQEKLDKFAEICLDSVLKRYNRYTPEQKNKRMRDKWKLDNKLRRVGKKDGKYDY